MSRPIEFLDLDDALVLATALLGDPPPVRDMGLLQAAFARPQTTVFGEPAYPDIWTMAAAILQSIVENHPLVDENKRLGWLATAVFLELNAVPIHTARYDDVYAFVDDVAVGSHPLEEIADQLKSLPRT